MARDAAWTFWRKYCLIYPAATLSEQQTALQKADYTLVLQETWRRAETQFRSYDPLAAALQQGQTLTTTALRYLNGAENFFLHQDERFYELEDGTWYLKGQQFLNQDLAELLAAEPMPELDLQEYWQAKDNPKQYIFWTGDPRFVITKKFLSLDQQVCFTLPDQTHKVLTDTLLAIEFVEVTSFFEDASEDASIVPRAEKLLEHYLTDLAKFVVPSSQQSWDEVLIDLRARLNNDPTLSIEFGLTPSSAAATAEFWRDQLPLTLLPPQGSPEQMRAVLDYWYVGTPQPLLEQVILPALGYSQDQKQWVWQQ